MHCQKPHIKSQLCQARPCSQLVVRKLNVSVVRADELPSQTLLRMADEAGKQIAKAGRKIVFVKGDLAFVKGHLHNF